MNYFHIKSIKTSFVGLPTLRTPLILKKLYSQSSLPTEKVVVFGGNGFLGQYVAKAFIADPYTKVQMVNRTGTGALQKLGNQILPPVKADITKYEEVLKSCEDASVIINLVGIMHEKKPHYTFESVQHQGAKNVAKVASQCGAKLVHVSAIGADASSDIPYCKTKGLGEAAVFEHCPEAVILRPSLVFGPEDDFFNRFAKLAKLLPFIPVFGGGHTKFQPVYVWDVARAIRLSITGPFQGKIIELGGPKVYTYKEMMKLLLEQAGIKRPIISVPWLVGTFQGLILEQLPLNLFTLTRDQVKLLKFDNIVSSSALGLSDLGLPGTPAERILHTYLRPNDLTTQYKRTHKMQSQDVKEELAKIKHVGSVARTRPNAPNLEKQLEYHMDPSRTKPKD